MSPTVSAIIPCFNTKDCVAVAIDSALNQLNTSVEVVVIDDGSSDGTPELVEAKYRDDERVRVIRQPQNKGPSAARNRGIANARGDWIALLDSDDFWRPERCEVLLQHASNADFICDNMMGFDVGAGVETGPLFDANGDRQLAIIDFLRPSSEATHDLGYVQPLIRRRFLTDQNIQYREDIRVGEDLFFNIQILMSGGRALFVDQSLYVYHLPVGTISRTASPHSRSTTNTDALQSALEQFRADFSDRLGPQELAALNSRLRQMVDLAPIAAFHLARSKSDFRQLFWLVLSSSTVRSRIAGRLFGNLLRR